jgi:hypothetical protein
MLLKSVSPHRKVVYPAFVTAAPPDGAPQRVRRFGRRLRVNRVGSAMSATCPLYLQQLP